LIQVGLIILSVGYAIGILILRKGLNLASQMTVNTLTDDENLPSVTVLVPARNEAENISKVVDDLSRQDYPRNKILFMIIDDFSEDGTAEMARNAVLMDERFRILELSGQTDYIARTLLSAKKRAIDFGVRNATTDFVLFTDADCRLGPCWARSMMSYLGGSCSIVAGHVGFHYDSVLKGALALESLATRLISAGAIGLGEAITCAGGNWGYRRQIYEKLGGFERYQKVLSGDDTLLIQSAVAKGEKAVFNFDKRSFVFTTERGSLYEIFIRRIRRLGITPNFQAGIMIFSALIFIYAWLLALTPVLALIRPSLIGILIAAWVWKFAFDFWILSNGAKIFDATPLLKYLPITGMIYPYYIAIVGSLSLVMRGSWKGRIA